MWLFCSLLRRGDRRRHHQEKLAVVPYHPESVSMRSFGVLLSWELADTTQNTSHPVPDTGRPDRRGCFPDFIPGGRFRGGRGGEYPQLTDSVVWVTVLSEGESENTRVVIRSAHLTQQRRVAGSLTSDLLGVRMLASRW